ncbi:hypothetical protein KQ51_00609 [Candidatus Izimaplasma bacterium HR1]|jgi:hypothetical protein|uniref:hypothetical protein n=1 Tax=Candidatus Izimoplasma sp. HR1 TaxID=1541959 RepID=UPI0004F81E9E|nr:hypothetical protein KQ51_00609 [Candidatus Izimaplasma bacterium HR1]
MGKKYISDNLDMLRKQRDEKILGGYRDNVAKTYKFIENLIADSSKEYCNPKHSEISKAVFGNELGEAKIRGYLKDLKKSDYLSNEGAGMERQIKLLKPLDF